MSLHRNRFRKLGVVLTLACFTASHTIPARASILSEMDSFYSELRELPADIRNDLKNSISGGVSGPGAFHGQTYHTYMGGQVFHRTPVRNLQLMTIDMPHFSAGCGGIDMYLGSISHLDGSKIVQFLKSVAMNMGGVIVQVALGAISPLLASKLEWAKDVADKINGFNLNSCQVAKSLVSGGMQALTMSDNADCVEDRMVQGGLNVNEARERCQTSSGQNNALQNARTASENRVSFKGNLTWEALKKVSPAIDKEEREMIMSLIGSWVFLPDNAPVPGLTGSTLPGAVTGGAAENGECAEGSECTSHGRGRDDTDGMGSAAIGPIPVFPTISDIPDFLLGNGSSAAAPGRVRVVMYNCPDEACLHPSTTEREIESLSERVSNNLREIAYNIIEREQLTPNQINLINQTSLPVWKMLSLGTQMRNSGMAEMLIANYRDVIAADHVWTILSRGMKSGLAALHQKFRFNTVQEQHIVELQKSAVDKLDSLKRERDSAHAKVANLAAVSTTLETLERQLRTQMPQQVVDLLAQQGVRGQR